MNYRYIHRIYHKSLNKYDKNIKPVKYQIFRRIWLSSFPNIVFSKTKSDLCITCENNKHLINEAIASGDNDKKLNSLQVAKEHILAAKEERDYYRGSIEISRKVIIAIPISLISKRIATQLCIILGILHNN